MVRPKTVRFGTQRIRVKPTEYRLRQLEYTQERNGLVEVERPAQTVERKGYTYTRKRVVPLPRGKRVVGELRKGKMTDYAVELGYIKEGQRVSDIPANRIGDFAKDLADRVGARKALRMFSVQKTFRRRQPDHFKNKVDIAIDAIQKKYAGTGKLAPREAIRRWKSMSHRARVRARRG